MYAWRRGELSVLRTRCGGGFPRAPREGAAPPSNPSKGGSAPWPPEGGAWPHRTSRLLACGKGGGLHPRRAALLRAARAESLILQLGGNTRTRAEDSHRPSVSERPKARRKVLCQAFFQESGGRLAGGGAGGVGEGGQFTGGVVHSPAEILRPLAVQLQNHRVSREGFGAVVLADGHDFPV